LNSSCLSLQSFCSRKNTAGEFQAKRDPLSTKRTISAIF
jgi:hypothetical protein